ncbi:MAG: squalene--hopene cyclase, partial [Chloroflexota bacterium]
MALFGEYPWDGVPSMPPELIHLPSSAPLNLYDFACWARGTVAPLLIVISRRPVRSLGCSIQETIVPGTEPAMHRVPGSGPFWWADALMKVYEGLPGQPLRSRARSKIVDWIVERQEADGSWGGIQPPWVYSLIALSLEGMSLDHPVMRKGLSGLDGFALADAEGWRLQACMSPVWDTAWAILALRWAGVERSHGSLLRAVEWTLSEQIQNGGDWEIRCPPGTPSGGWAFEFQNDVYPDIDDTAVVAVALLDASERPDIAPALDRACRWVLAMRSDNGAWAAFDRNNTSEIVYKLPFADFGAMLDPPSEDVTAHVLEMLVRLGYAGSHPAVAGALRYLAETQTPEGAWFGRWGSNYIYGTWCVLSALRAFARPGPEIGEMVRRGTKWMLEHQNHDGGWGETLYSYEDPSFAGVGISAPSQTAWAVMALQFAGMGGGKAVQRGLEFLRER